MRMTEYLKSMMMPKTQTVTEDNQTMDFTPGENGSLISRRKSQQVPLVDEDQPKRAKTVTDPVDAGNVGSLSTRG